MSSRTHFPYRYVVHDTHKAAEYVANNEQYRKFVTNAFEESDDSHMNMLTSLAPEEEDTAYDRASERILNDLSAKQTSKLSAANRDYQEALIFQEHLSNQHSQTYDQVSWRRQIANNAHHPNAQIHSTGKFTDEAITDV